MDDEKIYGFHGDDVRRIARDVKLVERLGPPGMGGGKGPKIQQLERCLVVIIGTETGGGIYQGSIMYGQSDGGDGGGSSPSAPGSYNFQLQEQFNQNQTDGPAPLKNPDGSFVNNALVVNLAEPYVNGTHLLWDGTPYMCYAMGWIMGATNESTPRTIVYVDKTPLFPVVAKITGSYSPNHGVYYGRILQGQFCNASNFGYASQLSDFNPAYLPDVDNCWITNQWEQTYAITNTTPLAVGTYIWGFVVGFPLDSSVTSGNTSEYNIWYQIYTWFPVQSATLRMESLVTTEFADPTYGSNEQTMLNNLRIDTENIQAALSNLYANLKAAGYSLSINGLVVMFLIIFILENLKGFGGHLTFTGIMLHLFRGVLHLFR